MSFPLRYNTASQEVPLGYFLDSGDGNTEETGLTIANTDIKLWKNGATTLANKNSGGGTHISNGIYYATLDATDSNTLGPMVIFVHVSGALAVRLECVVYPQKVYDALIAESDNLEVDVTLWKGSAAEAMTGDAYAVVSNATYGNSNLKTLIDTIDSLIDAVKAKTDNLPADPADDSDIDSQLATIAGYLDTEIAAILAAVDTEVAAIKAKTDSLTFTVAGMVDANVVDWKGATAPAMTGDAYARLGAPAGVSIAADLVAIDNFVDDLESRITATRAGYLDVLADLLEAGRLDLLIDGIKTKTDNLPSDPADQSAVEAAITAAHSTTNGKIDAVDDFVDSEIAAILADTNELQTDLTNGGRLDLLIDAIKAKTDGLTFTVAGVLDANATYWKGSVAPAMTGDAYARLGAPTGASVSADVASLDALIDILTAYVDTEVAAIKLKTDNLPANPAATGDIPSALSVADAVWDEAISGHVGAGTFGLKNQKAVPSETLSDYMADVSGLATAANLAIVDGLIDTIKATIDSYLDVAVSSRLASASYVAPANTYISDIKAKTDNLPANPAAVGSAMTLDVAYDAAKTAAQASDIPAADITAIKNAVESATYGLAALKTLIDAIKAKSDLIPADIATALAHLNADIDSRMATFSYTAPANADIAAVKVVTDYLTAMLETDGAVTRYTANALEQAPTAPTVEEIRAEMDTNSTKLANLDMAISAIPTAGEIDSQLSGEHGAGAWGTAGTGSSTYTDAITDDDGDPLEDVQVELYSDSDYTTLVAVESTDVNGVFTFSLNPGTYYVRCIKSGYDFTDFSEVVT